LICTEWHAFRNPNFDNLKTALKSNVIFDGRNIYNPNDMTALGFDYYSVGR
jgi:UDPglucose 6-dehydrogenase